MPHPFPKHDAETVREAPVAVGFKISIPGSGDPIRGEDTYFQDGSFGDETLGQLADILTLHGIGTYVYALFKDSLGPGSSSAALFPRIGSIFPREGCRIFLTHMWVGEVGGRRATATWFFDSPKDLEEANIFLGSYFDTEPTHDLSGTVAIEVRYREVASGQTTPVRLIDEIFAILGASGFEGPVFCFDQSVD